MLKSVFSKLFRQQGGMTSREAAKSLKIPPTITSKHELCHYVDFSLPDLQLIKLSLDSGQQEKALDQFFQYIKTRAAPMGTWGKRDEIVYALKEQYPESAQTLLKAADNILQHRFLLFSKHTLQTASSIFWNANYEYAEAPNTQLWESGKSYARDQLLADPRGDIHFVWALNRHQHFIDLGKAYWYTGEEEFVKEFMTEITEWLSQNPYRLSVNWVDSYEIALRGIFWIFGYMFFISSDRVDEDFFCRFYEGLLLHGHAIFEFVQAGAKSLELHHIIASAAFLYLLGTVFPEYIHSKTLSKCGWEILQWRKKTFTLDQIVQEPLAVLVNAIELYCIVLIVRRNNRYHIPQTVIEGLMTMLEQLSLFVKPNGNLTRIGEYHPIQLLRGMYAQSENFQYLYSMAAVLLKKGEFKSLGKAFEEPLLWFLGLEGYREFEQLEAIPLPQQSYLAPNASYAVMRSGWGEESGYCIIANNPVAPERNHRSKHADLLSVEVYASGHELLMDAGPYSLQDEEWNRYFCSVPAHNGITVDRITHLNFSDRNIRGEFDQWVSTPAFDFVSGYHTGFEDLEQPVTHRRSIFYRKPNYWIICDLLIGEGQHLFDQFFHFSPLRVNVDFSNKGVNVKIDEHHQFALIPVGSEEMDVMIFKGGDTPDSGWISDGYKHHIEAPFIKYGKRASVPTGFYTLLYAYDPEQSFKITGRQLRVSSQGTPLLLHEVLALEISFEQETHYFVLLYKDCQDMQFENMTFNGSLLFVRKQGDHILEIILHHATLLKMDECTLFQSDTPVEGFYLRVHGQEVHVSCSGNFTFRTQFPQIEEMFVNERKIFLKREDDTMVVNTSRV